MSTDHSPLRTGIVAAVLTLVVGLAHAQTVEQPASWRENEQIDAQMGTLQGPLWKPVWFTREDAPGRPSVMPIYKQQPPGAQGDFRIRPATPAITPVTTLPDTGSDQAPEPTPEPEPEPQDQNNGQPSGDNQQTDTGPDNSICSLGLILC